MPAYACQLPTSSAEKEQSPRVMALVMAGLLLGGCHGHARRGENELVRFRGPVRLILTAVLVAPGKDSGLPWDGLGSLPPEVAQGLRAPRPRGMIGTLFRALTSGTAVGTLTTLLPWTVNEPGHWQRLLDWGVDGITTDVSDLLARYLAERGIAF